MHDITRPLILAAVLSSMVVTLGCRREPAGPPPPTPPPKPQGVANAIAEQLTGYGAVKHGEAMKRQIKEIAAEHDKQMEQILDDKPEATPPPTR